MDKNFGFELLSACEIHAGVFDIGTTLDIMETDLSYVTTATQSDQKTAKRRNTPLSSTSVTKRKPISTFGRIVKPFDMRKTQTTKTSPLFVSIRNALRASTRVNMPTKLILINECKQ